MTMFLWVTATEPISTSPLIMTLPARSLTTTRAPVRGSISGKANTWETNDTGSSLYCGGMMTSMLPWLMARAMGAELLGLQTHLAVDHLDHVLGDLEIGVVLFQHQRDLAVLGEDVEELLFQPAAVVDAAGGRLRRILQRDRAVGEGQHAAVSRVGADQRREKQPPAGQALRRAHRADHAVELVALAGARAREWSP